MHPEILRAISAQRNQELQERAHQSRLARMAIRGRRHRRNLPDDDFVVPAVPDYVDGSFRTDQAVGQVASEAGPAPARHAA
ncbi:MAG: hypothetical protein ACRDPF_31405 [Streptosporangiaceae bacterium]